MGGLRSSPSDEGPLSTPCPHIPMRAALLLLVLLALASLGKAQSLAQVRLDGVLTQAALAEVEIGAMVDGQARKLDVHVFLARGSSGADLVGLVASRLESSGFQAHLGPVGGDMNSARALFVEGALFVNLRMNGELFGTITCSAGPPNALRVSGGQGDGLAIDVVAGVFNPATKQHGTLELKVPIESGMHPARCSERLMKAAAVAKWASDRPNPEFWRPIRLADGRKITGFSVSCHKTRVELVLSETPK
jgi:hypothetical protein